MTEDRPPTAYGYARVSTAGQVKSGLGQADQRQEIEVAYRHRYAKSHAWGELIEDPAESAGKVMFLDRPGGRRLNDLLRRGDLVIVAKLDRAFRSLRDAVNMLHAWEQRGVAVVFCDCGGNTIDMGTATGKIVVWAWSLVAELEWGRIRERCQASVDQRRDQDRFYGGAKHVYGYRITRDPKRWFYPDPATRRLGAWMVRQQDALGHTAPAIRRHLNTVQAEDGSASLNPFTGKPWTDGTVLEWVARERDLQTREAAAGVDNVTTFLMPSGRVKALAELPPEAQAYLRQHLAPAPEKSAHPA